MKIIIEAEDTILHSRDPLHIVIWKKYPHRVVKAKKGKGSYKRKEKHKKANGTGFDCFFKKRSCAVS